MTLKTQAETLATRIGVEIKTVREEIAAKPDIDDEDAALITTYSSVKVDEQIATGLATKPDLDDDTATASTVYSSDKVDSQITDGLATKPDINDTTASEDSLYSSFKVNTQISTATGDPTTDFVTTFEAALV